MGILHFTLIAEQKLYLKRIWMKHWKFENLNSIRCRWKLEIYFLLSSKAIVEKCAVSWISWLSRNTSSVPGTWYTLFTLCDSSPSSHKNTNITFLVLYKREADTKACSHLTYNCTSEQDMLFSSASIWTLCMCRSIGLSTTRTLIGQVLHRTPLL